MTATRASIPGLGRRALLVLCIVMFGQVFHYMIDAGPLYYLSKAWPVLTLPLTVYALARLDLPHRQLFLWLLVYILGITPLLSMIYLDNRFVDAAATTAKTMPFAYFFAAAGALALLRPAPAEVTRILAALGVATFGAMIAMWIVVPNRFYSGDPAVSKLFLYDFERGYRIFMPMVFGVLWLFYLTRRLIARPSFPPLLGILIGLAAMLLIYKQRTPLGAALLVMGWRIFTALPRGLKAIGILAGMAAMLAVAFLLLGPFADALERALGGSWSIRQSSIAIALAFLERHPISIAFGAGSVTRLAPATLATLLGDPNFYLADIGWLGVIFEYGMIGAGLILAAYLVALRHPQPLPAGETRAMAGALGDYAVYALVSTLVYSAVYAPGEIATVLALSIYLERQGGIYGENAVEFNIRNY